MSRWLYQMSESSWPFENYRRAVKEGTAVRWPTNKRMFAHEAPAAGDIIICFLAPAHCASPGICGFGVITKYLPRTRKFDWLPLPPTNALKRHPWWDDRAQEIADLARAQSPRGTMYHLPGALDTDLRRGLFAWVNN